MASGIKRNLEEVKKQLKPGVRLIAVSKTKPVSEIMKAYDAGQRDFGENKVQEMVEKYEQLPKDIRWHLIGHLQSNKVKYIAGFVHLIHSVDSEKLLLTIQKGAAKQKRVINCLLQLHIAEEETKFGLSADEARQLLLPSVLDKVPNLKITGLMGMATFTEKEEQIRKEFRRLKGLFDELRATVVHPVVSLKELSMGMSGDFLMAMEEGSTMVRVGSSIFGERNY